MHRNSLTSRFLAALAFLGVALSLQAAEAPLPASPKAAHVVLVVWDGMRPNFIDAENTPNAFALAQRGTFFANNHSFWPTTTEVNGTVLATGTFPARSTIVANKEYRPDIDPRGPIATDALAAIRKGDALTGGHYIATSTVAEIVRKAGFPTAVAGTKAVALLHDRSPERPEAPRSAIVFAGEAIPAAILGPITAALGPFVPYKPDAANPQPNTAANRWTTRALLEHLWRDGVPRYSVLWLSDPDFPQHAAAPGHPAALAGIHDSDTNLGLLVEELKKRGELDKTDIFLVSDHGFSTIERTVEPAAYFTEHGVPVSIHFSSPPRAGQVMSVSVGGATGLYVIGHEKTIIAKLVDLLQASDFAGPIFTREALPGTFPLSDAHIDSPGAADIVFSFRWNGGMNAHGIPGLILAEGRSGAGMHGSLGEFDIHNTLLAGGPDIRAGFRDEYPTGNIDVGATILHLLGIAHPDGVDGRVLTEALVNTPLPDEKPVTKRVEATRTLEDGTMWKQYLQVSSFGGKSYFDEGNAEGRK
jgi:arylsulfatase A-like enzyme